MINEIFCLMKLLNCIFIKAILINKLKHSIKKILLHGIIKTKNALILKNNQLLLPIKIFIQIFAHS